MNQEFGWAGHEDGPVPIKYGTRSEHAQTGEVVPVVRKMKNSDKYYCYHCGSDWGEWLDVNLSDLEREQILEKNPEASPENVYEGRCPSCGISYADEEDELDD